MQRNSNGYLGVFNSGLSKFFGRQPLKNLKGYGLLPYLFKFFKGCLPQNLLSSLLNTLSHLKIDFFTNINEIIERDIKNSLSKICLILNTFKKKILEQFASEILQNGHLLDIYIYINDL